ncbi:Putative anti-sigma factor antagonist BtrV [Chlamydia avium]|uniref:Anti-sigma factor antagonist n=2 Tax=Chlamydia avium TaxID=1457141 RepID=W8JRL1_9CHLA|nr:STAS domain-containing protein [Chlamydia avium]AHK63488.1 Putative anti-sigma factor antagonist BtrV [Chlamydia avium 10DC88]EPP37021.1 anti-anti-sigma factor family protein [Chlamydia psittaci 10_743_SC13]EPP38914.1 anti-anti-sigma factor family protein [Chlamydia avium]VVT43082.1 Putative anti-sigma factor antagonist BtrV [Chlamydia avium]
MDWLVKQYGGILVVTLNGDLDAVSVPHTEAFLESKLQEGKNKIVLNLQNVFYMSSAGIRLIFSIAKLAQSYQGLVCLCCAQDNVAEVLKIAGVNQVLPVCHSEQECFSRF